MRMYMRVLAFGLVLCIGAPVLVWATPPAIRRVFQERLDVAVTPETVGPVELLLQFQAPADYGRIGDIMHVEVTIDGPLVYHGPNAFDVQLTDDMRFSRILKVTTPSTSDTIPSESCFKVMLSCGEWKTALYATFFVLGEEVKFIPAKTSRKASYYFPQLNPPPPPSADDLFLAQLGLSKKMLENPDMLTKEQLQIQLTVAVDLRKPENRRLAENLLGHIPDSAAIPGIDGGYILDLTLDHILQLGKAGIEIQPTQEFRQKVMKGSSTGGAKSKDEEMGLAPESPPGISIDHVDGEISPGDGVAHHSWWGNVRQL